MCCTGNSLKSPMTSIPKKSHSQISNRFEITGEKFDYSCQKNFNFTPNSNDFISPISDSITIGIQKLKAFLKKSPNAKVTLTGYCLTSEKNNSAFPNLGFARAVAVKNFLTSKGIPANQLDIDGKVVADLEIENQQIIGPLKMSISNDITETKGEDWEAFKKQINANPLTLYFNSNQTAINLTQSERNTITEITKYLDQNPASKIICVGHTDNAGDHKVNVLLGLERANFAKKYLIDNGIASNRITTSSKGPDEPIAENITADGRAKNRRTVITIE
ncbi:OmpA family protein [Flavobacterium sp.]|uniref:OmpA family protein n=1 Tax=Flavobacterium sp. TaxID=239 RepID=UPI003D11D9CC